MTPTVFRHKGYRFFFFSREEERMHVHVQCGHGEAKFWVEPQVAEQGSWGLTRAEVRKLLQVAKEKRHEIANSWREHFGS